MLQVVSSNRGDVGVCGTCMDARGIKDAELLDGARRSTPETADGRAGLGTGNFYAEPVPQVRLHPPSRWWHWGKVLFERRWLGRIDREPR